MSRSLARVQATLEAAGLPVEVREMADSTRTAADAAAAVGCEIDQIVKSIVLAGRQSGTLRLFLVSGGNQVDLGKAGRLAGEPLQAADPRQVRQITGFAIGGVAPVGHLSRLDTWFDGRLMEFGQVWAAAGTPRHVFGVAPDALLRMTRASLGSFVA